ncbi:YceK/YidQ family lipoprotein [Verrucomicrobia bacterium S94]|nr:YceK/YidQ family lipoprotein [Verrucomicrobia bacterium S94]
MKNTTFLILSVSFCSLILFLVNGYGTIAERYLWPKFDESFGNENKPSAKFYIGTKADISFAYSGITKKNYAGALFLVDVPFSLVADTLYVPVDCYYLLKDSNKK